jgi:hypothetical protein
MAAAGASAAAHAAAHVAGLASLPRELVGRHIFGALPVDLRLRCREVCTSWRDTLSDVSIWQRLDLSVASGGLARPANELLLRAAVARAGGQLQALNLFSSEVRHSDALAAVTANAATLRELCSPSWREDVELGRNDELQLLLELLRAAPHLQVCNAHVECTLRESRAVLRNESPFEVVRVHELEVLCNQTHGGDADDAVTEEGSESARPAEEALMTLAADVRQHASLTELHINFAWLAEASAFAQLVDAALAMRLSAVEFSYCRMRPDCRTALVRLLGGAALTSLHITEPDTGPDAWLFVEDPALTLLCNALEENGTLTSLTLSNAFLWDEIDGGVQLIGALTAHRSLRTLSLWGNSVHDAPDTAGDAFFELLAANSPALEELKVQVNGLGDIGLGRLFDALPHNTHLRRLDCSSNGASEEFMRIDLLPAVLANSSLRELEAQQRHPPCAATLEAELFVSDREEARQRAA